MAGAADVNFAGSVKHPLVLSVTTQAEVCVLLREHFTVHRTVRLMANGAAFMQRFMLENKSAGLLAMALRATFVDPGHRLPAVRFHDVHPMRVMALDAAHPAFENRMMLRKVKVGVHRQVTLETGLRLLSGINDEFAVPTTSRDMFAARTMTRFAPLSAFDVGLAQSNTSVWARRKGAADVGMAIRARFVADISGAVDLLRRDHGASVIACAGTQEHRARRYNDEQEQGTNNAFHRHWLLSVRSTRHRIEPLCRS